MPTYTYRCTNPDCLHESDHFHGINKGGAVHCTKCNYPMKKLLSPTDFVFKQKRGTMGVTTHGKPGKESRWDDIS
jgi:putative FmdB family regulatory protein